MEAKDADRSHQDICHFMATASLISDKASSPHGHRMGEAGWCLGAVAVRSSRQIHAAVNPPPSPSPFLHHHFFAPFFFFFFLFLSKQLVPVTTNHTQCAPLIIILGRRHQSRLLRVLTRGCAVISGLCWREFHHRMFSKYRTT